MIYIQLFLSFLQVGLFSFGGGYAALPLIQSQIVDAHRWLDVKRIYRSYYIITDDTRTDRHQFGNICRN